MLEAALINVYVSLVYHEEVYQHSFDHSSNSLNKSKCVTVTTQLSILALHIERDRPSGLKHTRVSSSIHTSIFR
jgi:hypothetical protein